MDIEEYARRYTGHYDGRPSFERVLIGARRRQVLRSIDRYPHRRILEIGCGLEPLSDFVDDFETLVVVEPIERFAGHAQDRAGADQRIVVLQEFFERAAHRHGRDWRPDLIVASSLLHEVADPQALLAAIREVCLEHTVVHLNTPNARSVHRLLAVEMGLVSRADVPSELDRAFGRHSNLDRDGLIAMVQQAGFDVLRFGTYFLKPFTNDQMASLMTAGIATEQLLRGLEAMTEHLPEHGAEMYVELRRSAPGPA